MVAASWSLQHSDARGKEKHPVYDIEKELSFTGRKSQGTWCPAGGYTKGKPPAVLKTAKRSSEMIDGA